MPRATATAADQALAPRKRQLKFLVLGAAGAGKTSLLRRYFYKQFDHERMPTVGSDFYVGKMTHCHPPPATSAGQASDEKNDGASLPAPQPQLPSTATTTSANNHSLPVTVNLQMWDTPGKENFALHRHQQHHVHYSATLSDSFFQHADAIMLVYDMTSSTSFTRLLKWYSDLMELFAKTAKPIPILIVANKLDLFQASIVRKALSNHDDDKPETTARTATSQPRRRNVMGFTGEYYGQHFHYEYQICSPEEMEQGVHGPMYQIPTESADHSLTKRSGNKKAMTKRHVEISSYLVNRDNWTTDGSYLDSLLHSEDGSHPDRELVLLWCARNGLQMVEMSAATGEGVNEAIEALVALALHTQHNQLRESQVLPSMTTATPPEALPTTKPLNATVATAATAAIEVFPVDHTVQARTKASEIALYTLERPNKELDLHQRYAKKDNNCFSLIPSFRHCLK